MRIGIDMMEGGIAPGSTIRGSIFAGQSLASDLEIVLVGDQDILFRYKEKNSLYISRLSVDYAPDQGGVKDRQFKGFREKSRASIFSGQRC